MQYTVSNFGTKPRQAMRTFVTVLWSLWSLSWALNALLDAAPLWPPAAMRIVHKQLFDTFVDFLPKSTKCIQMSNGSNQHLVAWPPTRYSAATAGGPPPSSQLRLSRSHASNPRPRRCTPHYGWRWPNATWDEPSWLRATAATRGLHRARQSLCLIWSWYLLVNIYVNHTGPNAARRPKTSLTLIIAFADLLSSASGRRT